MNDRSDLHAALVAIATIVDDIDTPAEERFEGIRDVLTRIGIRRRRVEMPPDYNPDADRKLAQLSMIPSTPAEARLAARTPAAERLAGILKATERVASLPTPPSSSRPRAQAFQLPPKKKARPPVPAPKPPKPLIDDPERQKRIQREFAGPAKRPKKGGPASTNKADAWPSLSLDVLEALKRAGNEVLAHKYVAAFNRGAMTIRVVADQYERSEVTEAAVQAVFDAEEAFEHIAADVTAWLDRHQQKD